MVADADVVMNKVVKPQVVTQHVFRHSDFRFLVLKIGLPSQVELMQTVLSGCSRATCAASKHVDQDLRQQSDMMIDMSHITHSGLSNLDSSGWSEVSNHGQHGCSMQKDAIL